MDFSEPFQPISNEHCLSLMLTFQCTAECKHCGTLSSPREKTWLPLDKALSAIEQAATAGYKVVVFTGGEATLAGEKLLSAIRKASDLGLSTRLVTNAYWATTDKAAEERINALISAGLKEINFSTGDQHARFVPIENIVRATRASAKAGINVFIMVETMYERKITKETVEGNSDFAMIRKDYPQVLILVMESPWMPLGSNDVAKYPAGFLVNRSNLHTRTGCDSVLSTPTIEADGSIYACCGIGTRLIPELKVGNIREMSLSQAVELAESDFLKHWIRVEGPERILEWASNYDKEIIWENMYAHRCQACIRLYTDPKVRKVILEHYKEKMPDVLFNEWVRHHYKGATNHEEQEV